MKRIISNPFCFADDKDIKDLLEANPEKYSNKRIRELARRRGMYVSSEDDRESLVDSFSFLPFDWHQIDFLLSNLGAGDRAKKQSVAKIISSISMPEMREIISKVQVRREKTNGENFKTSTGVSTKLSMTAEYTRLDYSKAKLLQHVKDDIEINIETTEDGFVINYDNTLEGEEILSEIISTADKMYQQKGIEKVQVSLEGINDPNKRTKFFIDLISNLERMQLRDVLSIKVIHLDRIDDEQFLEDVNDTDGDIVGVIRKVALQGLSLLNEPHYKDLTNEGMCINSITWRSDEVEGEEYCFECEAGFESPKTASGFSYQIRAVYKKNADGNLKTTSNIIREIGKREYERRIENSALSAMLDAIGSNDALFGSEEQE